VSRNQDAESDEAVWSRADTGSRSSARKPEISSGGVARDCHARTITERDRRCLVVLTERLPPLQLQLDPLSVLLRPQRPREEGPDPERGRSGLHASSCSCCRPHRTGRCKRPEPCHDSRLGVTTLQPNSKRPQLSATSSAPDRLRIDAKHLRQLARRVVTLNRHAITCSVSGSFAASFFAIRASICLTIPRASSLGFLNSGHSSRNSCYTRYA